ncbi:MAG: PD40 domain-containing protein [Chloroflexi bacterium]|nr:PD40 domain-containing protein [Chloroflexota bacterium]
MPKKLLLSCVLLALALAVIPAQAQLGAACRDSQYAGSRLVGGMYARVTPGSANNVRESASTSAALVAQIEPGQVVYITSAPVCAEGYVWWQVMFREPTSTDDFPFGYTVEGAPPLSDGDYWLEPVTQTLAVPQERTLITAENAAPLAPVAQAEFGMVNRLVWSPDGTHLAVNTVGATWVYDLTKPDTGPTRLTPYSYETNYTGAIAIGADNDAVLTAGGVQNAPNRPQIGAAYLWALASPDFAQFSFTEPESDFGYGGAAAVSPTFTQVAFAGGDGTIRVYDAFSGEETLALSGHTLVGALAYSPDGQFLVSVGTTGMMVSDTTARLWNAATGEQIVTLDLGEVLPFISFSGDSRLVALAVYSYADGTQRVHVLEATTFTTLYTLDMARGGIGGLSLNADGSLLAISNVYFDDALTVWDSALRLYEVASGAEVAALPVLANSGAVAFSPDGTLIAFAYEDPMFWGPNRVTLWALP